MSSGLDGVIAAETVLTLVDGARGIWWLRGHGLQEVIAERGYEGAAALLWEGFAGTDLDRPSLRDALGAGRAAAFPRVAQWLAAAERQPLAEAVRIALAAIPDVSAPADVAGTLPVALAALLRARAGARQRARRLSHHGDRQWPRRLDLHRAGDRLDAGLARQRGARRLLRADRAAPWRRAGPGARHAR